MAKPDDYETQYMAGGGEVLLRDKTVSRLSLALVGIPALVSWGAAAAIAFGADPSASPVFALIPVSAGLVLTACAALFTVLRVVVSTQELHVQYGLFGPRIPIESIESCETIKYEWTAYGGWGVRMGSDGSWAYSVPGGSRAVRIRWRKGGESKTTVVTSEQADSIVDAVAQARAARGLEPVSVGAKGEPVRVESAAVTSERRIEPCVEEVSAEARAAEAGPRSEKRAG